MIDSASTAGGMGLIPGRELSLSASWRQKKTKLLTSVTLGVVT